MKKSQLQAKNQSRQQQLPDHMQTELYDAFNHFEEADRKGYISMTNLRGILWNFGMWRMTKKEMDEELSSVIDITYPWVSKKELEQIVSRRWAARGKDQEIEDTFKTFDRREKGQVAFADMKQILQQYLEITVTDQEIQELFDELDSEKKGYLNISDFYEFLKNEM